jgi:diguanylate cyclase (GGDEF)-like protein
MGAADIRGLEATGVHKILCLLDALRHSKTGAVIYRQVERMLEDQLEGHQTVEKAYLTLVTQLLDAYLGHLRDGSPMQMQVRLLQARLQPPLTASDLAVLNDYVELYASQIEAVKQLDSEMFRQAVEPLLASFGIIDKAPEDIDPGLKAAGQAIDVSSELPLEEFATDLADDFSPDTGASVPSEDRLPDGSYEDFWDADEEPSEAVPEQQPGTSAEAESFDTGMALSESNELDNESNDNVENQVDTAYRSHLDSKRRDIQKLQSTLAQQVLGTIAQNEEFGVLLEVVLGELRQASDGNELQDLRWTLIREIEKLTKGHHELAEQLDSTHHYLQLIETDSRQLSDELTRVRLLSLTDELTGLPNRRAFLRRIEDEVARVQRYGFPLSLALIDLDHFKQVNDRYGHAGGDEVLQSYSKNILSIFRHHDLVARYGGEEFAVLLPNTDAEGSLRALTKVKNRAGETRWQANGDLIPVPTFSSGVSLYKPGETASAFIERADKALYRAKRLGRNRVEMDATYRSSDAGGAGPAKGPEITDPVLNETS